MKRKTLFLLISALLLPLAARAQSTTPQPAKPYSTLDNDPAFARLPPEEQAWLRQTMAKLNKAVADKDINAITQIQQDIAKHQAAANPVPVPPKALNNVPNTPAGCTALPVKTPKFHLPKPLQDAISKGAKNVGSKTGVDLDPNAPAQTVNNAQKNIPCPPAPVPAATPANK
jgi:hypothetical protein